MVRGPKHELEGYVLRPRRGSLVSHPLSPVPLKHRR